MAKSSRKSVSRVQLPCISYPDELARTSQPIFDLRWDSYVQGGVLMGAGADKAKTCERYGFKYLTVDIDVLCVHNALLTADVLHWWTEYPDNEEEGLNDYVL